MLKPRETVLLSIIGLCTAVAAGGGSPPLDRFALAAIAIVVGSGGTNGLTNFLDRKVDARMLRTQRRMLPSGLIQPPEKALAWAAFLVVVALIIALYLHPYAFISGVTGRHGRPDRPEDLGHPLPGHLLILRPGAGWLVRHKPGDNRHPNPSLPHNSPLAANSRMEPYDRLQGTTTFRRALTYFPSPEELA